MYGVWRLAARGEEYKPEGQWRSRTDAMSEYLEETNPGSTRPRGWRLVGILVAMLAHLSVSLALVAWALSRADR